MVLQEDERDGMCEELGSGPGTEQFNKWLSFICMPAPRSKAEDWESAVQPCGATTSLFYWLLKQVWLSHFWYQGMSRERRYVPLGEDSFLVAELRARELGPF